MPLYRAVYIRDGKPRGMTFAHETAESAAIFAERICANLKRFWPDVKLMTVLPGHRARRGPTRELFSKDTSLY